MTRSVKVGLDVDEKPFVAGVGRAEKAAEGLEGALDDVADSAKDTAASTERAKESTEGLGDSARDAGRGLNSLRDDAAKLDRQIDETARSVRELAREIARTSDEATRADLGKKLAGQQGKLREQTSLRKLIDVDSADGVGAQLAEKVSVQFAQKFGPLLARVPMGAAGGAIGAAIAVPVVAILGAAVSGAIVGGVGIGGVIGGLTIAAGDSRVQAAGKGLSDAVMGDLEASGARFVEPALAGIGIIRSAWNDVADDVDAAFASTAGFVEPLARGVADFVRELAPGVRDAAEAAGPIMDVVQNDLPGVGRELSELLSTVADNADEGASAIHLIFMGIEEGIASVSLLIDGFSTLYRWLVEAGTAAADFSYSLYGWMPIIGDQIGNNRDRMHELKDALDEGGDAGENSGMKIWGGLNKVDTAASAATVKVESLNEAIKRMAGENLTAEQANIRLEEAIDRATEAGAKNNAGIDVNTEKGRSNRSALLGVAEAANASAEAIFTQTGSQELASAATARGRTKFLEAAAAMGVGKKEAIALADKLFAIPEKRNTDVTVTANVQPAIDAALGVVARINNMHARINVSAEPSGGYGGSAHTGDGYSTGNRWGGVYEHARDGLVSLREAGIYTPSSPARYAFAEPATGGEAFVPKYGNTDRSLSILATAAKWYGAQIVPGGTGQTAAGGTVNHYYWQPQQANASLSDFEGFQRRQDALARVGRPR